LNKAIHTETANHYIHSISYTTLYWPHQSTSMTLKRATSHIKVSPPTTDSTCRPMGKLHHLINIIIHGQNSMISPM